MNTEEERKENLRKNSLCPRYKGTASSFASLFFEVHYFKP